MSYKTKRALIIAIICFVIMVIAIVTINSSSFKRGIVDMKGDHTGGLNRTINVYTANGDLIAQYKGKIDLEASEGGYVKFDYEGKRYIYYNCFVETIADIN